MTDTLHPHPDQDCTISERITLVAAIAELTDYLRSQQAAKEQRRSWRIAAIVFLASMVTSAAVTNAMKRPPLPKRCHQTEVMTVELRGNGVDSPCRWL